MKRLIALLAVGAAVAAVLAVPSVAGDTKGPPCANIVSGTGSYAYYEADFVTPLANPYVDWTFVLGAPACEATTYRLEIYNLQGTACWRRSTSRTSPSSTPSPWAPRLRRASASSEQRSSAVA